MTGWGIASTDWFSKPMLLIPLYRHSASDEIKRAPGGLAGEGFEVPKPLDFVRRHPRAVCAVGTKQTNATPRVQLRSSAGRSRMSDVWQVQLAMLVLKAGLKVGATQLGVASQLRRWRRSAV